MDTDPQLHSGNTLHRTMSVLALSASIGMIGCGGSQEPDRSSPLPQPKEAGEVKPPLEAPGSPQGAGGAPLTNKELTEVAKVLAVDKSEVPVTSNVRRFKSKQAETVQVVGPGWDRRLSNDDFSAIVKGMEGLVSTSRRKHLEFPGVPTSPKVSFTLRPTPHTKRFMFLGPTVDSSGPDSFSILQRTPKKTAVSFVGQSDRPGFGDSIKSDPLNVAVEVCNTAIDVRSNASSQKDLRDAIGIKQTILDNMRSTNPDIMNEMSQGIVCGSFAVAVVAGLKNVSFSEYRQHIAETNSQALQAGHYAPYGHLSARPYKVLRAASQHPELSGPSL